MIKALTASTNTFQVRIDNNLHIVSGADMAPAEAAEIAALKVWPWLRKSLDGARLAERQDGWHIYRLYYDRPRVGPKTATVAVKKVRK